MGLFKREGAQPPTVEQKVTVAPTKKEQVTDWRHEAKNLLAEAENQFEAPDRQQDRQAVQTLLKDPDSKPGSDWMMMDEKAGYRSGKDKIYLKLAPREYDGKATKFTPKGDLRPHEKGDVGDKTIREYTTKDGKIDTVVLETNEFVQGGQVGSQKERERLVFSAGGNLKEYGYNEYDDNGRQTIERSAKKGADGERTETIKRMSYDTTTGQSPSDTESRSITKAIDGRKISEFQMREKRFAGGGTTTSIETKFDEKGQATKKTLRRETPGDNGGWTEETEDYKTRTKTIRDSSGQEKVINY